MSKTQITTERVEKIINGEIEPANRAEDLLLMAYVGAIKGREILDVAKEVSEEWETYKFTEINFFIMGYGLGQTALALITKNVYNDKTKKQFH